jgi:hypothetical protein
MVGMSVMTLIALGALLLCLRSLREVSTVWGARDASALALLYFALTVAGPGLTLLATTASAHGLEVIGAVVVSFCAAVLGGLLACVIALLTLQRARQRRLQLEIAGEPLQGEDYALAAAFD